MIRCQMPRLYTLVQVCVAITSSNQPVPLDELTRFFRLPHARGPPTDRVRAAYLGLVLT